MIEVRRDEDNELCGYVDGQDGDWRAATVFGGELCRCDTYDEAVRTVLDRGLSSLASHWLLSGPGHESGQVVCIQSASPTSVTVALDYYSMPGVATKTITAVELQSGRWALRLAT